MNKKQVVIKKYENRRLYDSSRSRYVNLDDIAKLIRKGVDVQIVDARTGEDLTRSTLTQIIVEDNKSGPTGLPLELLRQLIVASDHVGKEFIMWYLKSAFDAYDKVQGALSSGLSEMQAAAISPVDTIKSLIRRGLPAMTSEQSEVEELRKRLADLEARVQEKPRQKRIMKKTARKK